MDPVSESLYSSYTERSYFAQQLSTAVREAFCRMHQKGMIYRANRLVNWCVKLNTTLSNLEVRPFPPLLELY